MHPHIRIKHELGSSAASCDLSYLNCGRHGAAMLPLGGLILLQAQANLVLLPVPLLMVLLCRVPVLTGAALKQARRASTRPHPCSPSSTPMQHLLSSLKDPSCPGTAPRQTPAVKFTWCGARS